LSIQLLTLFAFEFIDDKVVREAFVAILIPLFRSFDETVQVPPSFLEIFSTVLVLVPGYVLYDVAFDKIKGV